VNRVVAAAFGSWSFDPWIVLALGVATALYLRGFRDLYRRHPERFPRWRRAAFLVGLATFLLAVSSPIDAFADLLLQVHMAQHLLLMGVAPPLVWLGVPVNPILHGLPRAFLKQGLGPFLQWRALRRAAAFLVHPVTAWLAFAATTWIWHAPSLYQLALRSPFWHDVEHLCFFGAALLFWFPVVQPWPSRPVWPRAAMLPYLALAGVQTTVFSAVFAFSGRLFYPMYAELPRLWGISALDDQAAAGAVMWVPSSLILLVAVACVVVTMLDPPRPERPPGRAPAPARAEPVDLLRTRLLRGWLASIAFRRAAQLVLFGLAVAVVLDGLLGPSVSSMNLAGVLPWTWWRGLVVIGLLLAGNLFCFACPFTLPRRLARRVLGGRRSLPVWLRSKWSAVALFALYLVAYEVFDLWDSPWWTAWIVVGYFAAAFAIDGLYGGASFCRSLCPVGNFQLIGGTISPLEVAPRHGATCARCSSHDCLRGGPAGPGCQLDLFQPAKVGNLDCTFCLDCVRACPHDNVALRPRLPGLELVSDTRRAGIGRLATRPDLAAFALLFCFGAFVNAAAMVEPVVAWERSAARWLGVGSEGVWTALVLTVSLTGLPLLATALAGRLGAMLSRLRPLGDARRRLVRRFAFALIPLGFGMWLAHFSFHLATAGAPLVHVAARLGRAHRMGAVPLAPPDTLLPLEITALGVGLWVTVFVAWRIALDAARSWRPALALLTPWALLAFALWGAGLWILFQPMEMRGMVMG
jgi:cytochrome c oxidase assembly factor CtaG